MKKNLLSFLFLLSTLAISAQSGGLPPYQLQGSPQDSSLLFAGVDSIYQHYSLDSLVLFLADEIGTSPDSLYVSTGATGDSILLRDGSGYAFIPFGTDDQQIELFKITADVLTLTLEDGGTSNVNLSYLNDPGTDNQELSYNVDSTALGKSILIELNNSISSVNLFDYDADPTNEIQDLTPYLQISDTAAMLVNYALNSDILWNLSGTYSLTQKDTPNDNFFFGTNVGNTITSGSNNFILGSSADAITIGSNNFIAGNDNANVGTTLFSANTVFGSNNLTASLDIQNNFISGQNNLRDNTGRIWSNAIFGANNFIDGRGEYILGGGANSYTNTTANNQHSLIWGLRNGHLATTKGVLESSIVGYQNLYSGGSASRSNIIGFDNVFSCTGAISNSAIIGFRNGFASTGNFTESLILGNENLRTGTAFSSRSAVIGSQNAYNSSGLLTSVLMGYQNLYAATTQSSYNYLFGDRNYRSGTTVINSFAAGVENGRDASSVLHTSSTGYRNFYQATGTLSNSIAIGRENGYNPAPQANSIYFGYRQGYTTGAANRLMIGMTQDDPLIYGEFDNDLARINGDFEVRDELFVEDLASSGGTIDGQLFKTTNDQVVSRSIPYEAGYRRTASKTINTTSTDIDGWTEMYDLDSKYSITTATISVPENGTYKIDFNFDVTGTTEDKEYEVQLWNVTSGSQVRMHEFQLVIDTTSSIDNGHGHAQFIEALFSGSTYKIRMKERTGNSGVLLLVDATLNIQLKGINP